MADIWPTVCYLITKYKEQLVFVVNLLKANLEFPSHSSIEE